MSIERLIRQIVREEIRRAAVASADHSRPRSPTGIGVRDQGDPECEDSQETEPMDRTDTETDGESSSSEPTALELLQRMRAKRERMSASPRSTRKRVNER